METALQAARCDQYTLYTLKGLRTIGKICENNNDGDTCHMLIVVDGNIQKHVVRMMGYDSPEMKPSLSDPKRDEKKRAAVAAKERLFALCSGKVLYIMCHGADKYGRQLVTAYTSVDYTGLTINQQMINEGHGYAYHGGKKQTE